MQRAKPPARQQRKVGLDKPCQVCGQAIYFNYQGPIDGVCGRCSDQKLKGYRKPGSRDSHRDQAQYGVGWGWLVMVIVLAFLAGAVAGYLARPFLPL